VKDTVVVNDRWGIGSKCAHGGYYTCRNLHNPCKKQNWNLSKFGRFYWVVH